METIIARIERLALVRQQLRTADATPAMLEDNRLEIVRAQWDLSYALIERHVAPAEQAA